MLYTGELPTALQISSNCAKNYSFCDHNGCRDLTPSNDPILVNVTVPVTYLMDYTVTLTVCTNDVNCFTTTTILGE